MVRGLGIIIAIIVIVAIIGGYLLIASMQTPIDTGAGDMGATNGDVGIEGNTGGASDRDTDSSSGGTGGTSNQPQTYNVEISGFSFNPATLTIKQGNTVVWTNMDGVSHTVTSDAGSELGSSAFGNGQTYLHTFNTVGTYTYHCTPHPYMTGTIIVE